MKNLVHAQDEYIDFLEKYISGMAAHLHLHSSPSHRAL
jgi:hypothetical protein